MWGPPPSAVRRAQLDRLAPQRLRECSEMRFYITMKNSQCSLRAVAFLLLTLVASTLVAAAAEKPGKYLFYVGTYTEEGSKSKGIYAYRFDSATAQITPLGLAVETTNPSFLALHPNGHFLYSVNEVGNFKG